MIQGLSQIRLSILAINQDLAAIKFIETQEEVLDDLPDPVSAYKGHRRNFTSYLEDIRLPSPEAWHP